MIKGVNKQIVEINCTKDDYIQKAILFVNPQKSSVSRDIINIKAQNYLVQTGGISLETKHQAAFSKKLLYSSIIGAVVVSILAVVFHFIYQWSGNNKIVGLLMPTNESIFEHVKLLFFPFLLYSLVEIFIIKADWSRFWAAKGIAAILLPVMMIVFHYTYTGIVGYNVEWLDIAMTFVYIAVAFFISYKLVKKQNGIERANVIIAPVLIVITVGIILLSIMPPKLPLFLDTMTMQYGMK